MNKISELRILSEMTLAMAIGAFFALECRGVPYLALVGPPDLRFEVTATNNPLFTAELVLPKQILSAPPEPAVPGETNAVGNGAGQGLNAGAAEYGSAKTGGAAKNTGQAGDAASDLLNIQPQMVTEYLKPDQNVFPDAEPGSFQRGQSIMVPVELGFVPPIPGSRAIYISK
jgi:hypothetical protein